VRILFSALLLFTAVGPVLGSLTPPRPPRLAPHPVLDTPAPTRTVSVTGATVLYLDGKRCRMEDVPEGAEVERLELDRDGKTALRIDFRSSTPKARAK
jgi:hypothetical protein